MLMIVWECGDLKRARGRVSEVLLEESCSLHDVHRPTRQAVRWLGCLHGE
jgi:hypothetical protein